MSLLDALLLDPHPFNVRIAKRADGISYQAKFDEKMSLFAAVSNVNSERWFDGIAAAPTFGTGRLPVLLHTPA